ncbi:MAG TPA: hypothetical protein VEU32_12785 [Burkholderiales bacterium]|nr:hypothetical protein [Burkholderiales bacterium]
MSLVFGVLAWAQMPAVCGFMLSSTLVGAENYIYSIWLGVMIAVIGLASSAHAFLRPRRRRMLVAGAALSAGFLAYAAIGERSYDEACHAVYAAFPLPPSPE